MIVNGLVREVDEDESFSTCELPTFFSGLGSRVFFVSIILDEIFSVCKMTDG